MPEHISFKRLKPIEVVPVVPPPPPPPPPEPLPSGRWVDISRDGSTIAIGQSTADFSGGAIYMCRGVDFGTIIGLTAPGGYSSVNEYGNSVATNADGSIVVCGALGDGFTISGYAAVRHGTNWEDETILIPSGASGFLTYGAGGRTVAISDDGSNIVLADNGSPSKIFVCSGTDWADVIELTLPGGGGVFSVAISGDGTVVAAGNGYNKVHVFSGEDYTTYTLVTPSVPPDPFLGDFGWNVALNEDGSILATGDFGAGMGYLFSGEDWGTEQNFPNPVEDSNHFAWTTDISADGSVVTFTGEDISAYRYSGSGYSVETNDMYPGLDISLNEDGSILVVAGGYSVSVFTF